MPANKKLKDKTLSLVREHIKVLIKRDYIIAVTAESVAKKLDLKNHTVKQAFQHLNLEGLMSTPHNATKMWRGEGAATSYYLNRD